MKMVKGVTHCLLPTCDKVTWPFMNYCGKTHAQQGMKMGLVGKLKCLVYIRVHPLETKNKRPPLINMSSRNRCNFGASVIEFADRLKAIVKEGLD